MKLLVASLFLMFMLLSANFVMPVSAVGADRLNAETAAVFLEVCEVVTDGGNLNVRATSKNNARIIGKLRNGTQVNVLSRGDFVSRIAVAQKGKLLRGWVSNDYLGNCFD